MHHDITLKEVGIFKIYDSGGWERRTHVSLELQNKKCDLVLKSNELIFVWNTLIWNIWMKEIPFRGVWTAWTSEVPFRGVLCISLDSQLLLWNQNCPASVPGIYWEGIKKMKLEIETWIWMHFVAEAKHSVPTELNFLCLFPGIDSLLKLTLLPLCSFLTVSWSDRYLEKWKWGGALFDALNCVSLVCSWRLLQKVMAPLPSAIFSWSKSDVLLHFPAGC